MDMDTPQVTLLPAQVRRLGALTTASQEAVGVAQDGNTIRVFTGERRFDIDAKGHDVKDPQQERLC
jgi:hypothetical protein